MTSRLVTLSVALLFSTLLFPSSLSALGLKVSPSEIEAVVSEDGTYETKLSITNTSLETTTFRVYTDTPLASLSVEPSEFSLDSEESAEVQIYIQDFFEPYQNTTLSVVAYDNTASPEGLSVGSGIKIPTTLYGTGMTSSTGRSGSVLSAFHVSQGSSFIAISGGILVILGLIYFGRTHAILVAKRTRKK